MVSNRRHTCDPTTLRPPPSIRAMRMPLTVTADTTRRALDLNRVARLFRERSYQNPKLLAVSFSVSAERVSEASSPSLNGVLMRVFTP